MSFWVWFIVGYAVFVAAITGYAAHVALSGKDGERRDDAFRVLKLVWGTGTGVSGIIALMVRLHDSGVL